MPKRTLTPVEKKQLVQERLDKERLRYPDLIISVAIKDETNDRGQPQFTITRMKEKESNA